MTYPAEPPITGTLMFSRRMVRTMKKAVIEIGERECRLGATCPQFVNERRRVVDAEWIGLIHHDLNVGVLCGSTHASRLGDTVGGVFVHDRDLLDLPAGRFRNCEYVIDLR